MSIQGPTSELKHYLRFPLQDRESRSRFVLGCTLMLAGYFFPILPGLLVYGYVLQILQRTAKGEAPSMPAWDDWPGLLSLGFRGFMIQLVFTLPGLVVFLVGFVAYFGAIIPFSIASSTEASVSDPAILLVFVAMVVLFLSMFLGSILLMLGIIPLPACVSHVAAQDRFSAAFRIREWWRILSANKLGYFVAFVVTTGILGVALLGLHDPVLDHGPALPGLPRARAHRYVCGARRRGALRGCLPRRNRDPPQAHRGRSGNHERLTLPSLSDDPSPAPEGLGRVIGAACFG